MDRARSLLSALTLASVQALDNSDIGVVIQYGISRDVTTALQRSSQASDPECPGNDHAFDQTSSHWRRDDQDHLAARGVSAEVICDLSE